MPQASKHPKVAIVADWITSTGGAERVIYQLHKALPNADIYTSTYENDNGSLFEGVGVKTSWMQKLPKKLRNYKLLTIPRQLYFGNLKLKGYDIVISAGSNEAKALRAPDGIHYNICYTPTLFYWIKPEQYLDKSGTGGINPLWRLSLKILMPIMKRWDHKAAQRPDVLLAISTEVQNRIKKHYNRESQILFPSGDMNRFKNNNSDRHGFVTFGRQVQHKRFDLAIAACNLAKVDLVVVGDGPEHERLQKMAGPTISFKTNVSDEDMVQYISKAEAFIFPNEEDFGIVAVEAQAAGTPVIAYRGGGALDTVVEGVTGEFFDKQTPEHLAKAIKKFDYKKYKHKDIVDNAKKFSNETFRKNIQKIVRNTKNKRK